MNSPAKNEAEFDNLLGQLVDELAMTPPSQSAVSLVPELEPEPPSARVESTSQMAAEAAAAAGLTAQGAGSSNTVKIVGIITGSLTAVALAALFVFGMSPSETDVAPTVVEDDSAEQAEQLASAAAAQRIAFEQAEAEKKAAERAEIEAEYVRVEAARLTAELEEAKAKANKPRRPRRPKKPTKPGDDFDVL